MRGPRCAATIPGVEALTVIHYQRASTPPRNARPRPSRFRAGERPIDCAGPGVAQAGAGAEGVRRAVRGAPR
jgi:hypothetical protein